MNELSNKTAIITGASRGIGRAVALRLANAGARLVLNHLRDAKAMSETEEICRQAGAEVVSYRGDIGQPETAQKLCTLALDQFSRLDILVNNAGLTHEGLLATVDDEQITQMVSTQVMGLIQMTRAVIRPMLMNRAGAVINLSSLQARKPTRGNAVYAGCKGFVESFTRAMAMELGPKGIRVNAIAPGLIETEMTKNVLRRAPNDIADQIGLRRLGSPAEVADSVAFLASPQAQYINGCILAVDGAFSG